VGRRNRGMFGSGSHFRVVLSIAVGRPKVKLWEEWCVGSGEWRGIERIGEQPFYTRVDLVGWRGGEGGRRYNFDSSEFRVRDADALPRQSTGSSSLFQGGAEGTPRGSP
jgi:hypothetical protein